MEGALKSPRAAGDQQIHTEGPPHSPHSPHARSPCQCRWWPLSPLEERRRRAGGAPSSPAGPASVPGPTSVHPRSGLAWVSPLGAAPPPLEALRLSSAGISTQPAVSAFPRQGLTVRRGWPQSPRGAPDSASPGLRYRRAPARRAGPGS